MSFSLILGRNLVSWSCCGSQTKSEVLSTSFWRGLHFLRSQGPNPDFRRSGWSHGARSARFFQDVSTLSTPQISKIRSPTGAPGNDWPSLGSQLSNTWKKTCFLISSLILGSSTGRILSILIYTAPRRDPTRARNWNSVRCISQVDFGFVATKSLSLFPLALDSSRRHVADTRALLTLERAAALLASRPGSRLASRDSPPPRPVVFCAVSARTQNMCLARNPKRASLYSSGCLRRCPTCSETGQHLHATSLAR